MSVSDVLPLPPCPTNKRGRHDFNAVIPGTDDGYLTLFCGTCGTVRRMPVSGQLYVGSLDALTPAEIKRAVSG